MMIKRLTHAAIAFAVTAAVYQGYVVAVAPFVEPAWRADALPVDESAAEVVTGDDALHRYRELLQAYFPPEHWCFRRPPKALDNGQVLIVFDEYTQTESGELRVPLCAVVFFPRARDRSGGAPRDAIILESSGGAVLQMESQVDKAVNTFGKMQHGTLVGDVTIRSDMREPGPHDDLLLKTRELYMNEDRIHTPETVDMKLGEHHGFGRELEISFMKTEGGSSVGAGAIYGKLEELLVKHDVALTIAPGKMSFFGEPSPEAKAAAEQTPAPPIRIRSVGPLRIDFAAEVASFTDQVQVRQTHPDGKLDELLANELKLFFTRTAKWNSGDGVAPAESGASMAFEPASIEALGSPVVLKAPSRDATATGGRLWIELGPQRITLEGGEDVALTHQGAEIHSPMVQYQLPPKGSGQRIGTLVARGGAGWLSAIPDPTQPYQVLEVHWIDSMQIVRQAGQPVLVLDGRPRVSLAGTGRMWADRLQIFLRETPSDNAATPFAGSTSPLASAVVPETITASGSVDIQSAQLTGKVNQLEVKIDHSANAPIRGGLVPATTVSTANSGTGAAPPAATNPMAMFNPRNGAASNKSYNIKGITLSIDVAMRGKQADVCGLSVDGGVDFKEVPTGLPGEQPMQIEAEHLKVTAADTPNGMIEIRGGGGQGGLPAQVAKLSANGAKLSVPAIQLQRGTNEAHVNSPGEVQLMVDRDPAGNVLAAPQPMTITWRDSMTLKGNRITFLGDVRVQHASGWLRTRRLDAVTAQPLSFDGGGSQRPQLAQIECWEGVEAEFEQRDVTGVTSRQRLEMQSLAANQISGEIRGAGPGKIDSVHLAKATGSLTGLPGADSAPAAPRLMNEEVKLRHLHIDFVRGVTGNLHTPTVNVEGNVEAVYGPVANWEQRLAMSPGGDPEPEIVWITCDKLGVTESPTSKLTTPATRQVELNAEGHVVIEGQDKERSMFNATGHLATFDQSKGQFILEGNAEKPATIIQQKNLASPASPQSAHRIKYNQKSGIVEVEGLHGGRILQPAGK